MTKKDNTSNDQPYPPLVEKKDIFIYKTEAKNRINQLFDCIVNHSSLEKTVLSGYKYQLKFIPNADMKLKLNISPENTSVIMCWLDIYSHIIYIDEDAVLKLSELTIREILIHNLAHAARNYNCCHDFVWKRLVKELGGNPSIRGCGLTKPKFPYILCCPDETCIKSTTTECKKIGVTRICTGCRRHQKVYIPND